ncbi:replication initiator [Flindersiella endophytica]
MHRRDREGVHGADQADEDATPAHVVRFGAQLDMQGIVAASGDADRRIGYLTKYLGKSMADPIGDGDPDDESQARRAHIDRLHREVMLLPCSPRCANWLRYGIQPQCAQPGMTPGHRGSKAHDREHLGCGGRRVLVSRRWTGKTLTAHKADRIGAVHAVLEAAGIDMEDSGRCSATVLRPDGKARYAWEPVELDDLPTYTRVIGEAIAERTRWRQQYERAKQRAGPSGTST